MMNIIFIILFSVNLNIPDSVFLPTNALEISPPEWKFVFERGESDFIELGYHTIFGVKVKSFYLRAEEDYDYEPYVNIRNRYFVSTPYFSLSHNVIGLYRYNSARSFILRDTLDFYFSVGRIIPNITLLPGVYYHYADSTNHTNLALFGSLSVVYSGTEGVLTYLDIERPDILAKGNVDDIYRVGVGIMGSRKFVSLGLTNGLIPEFNLKVLITGGAYINLHYGYDVKTPDMYLYLYPDKIEGDSVLSVMEKRFSLLIDKEPINFNFTYSVPDYFFKKSMEITFTFKDKYVDLLACYFKTYKGNLSIFNRAVSKGEARFHIPLWKSLKYTPIINVYRVQDKPENVYNIGGRLEYTPGKLQFFWEHNIYTHGVIEDYIDKKLTFYTGRRFKIGAKYIF